MKKLLFICAICLSAVASKAQTAMTNPNGLALDTASQVASEGPKLRVPGPFKTVSIVLTTTKISGTIAGTVSWQGSNDGVTYGTISTTSLTDASGAYVYKEVDKGYLYYKALITQSGTSSLSYKASLYTTGAAK